MHTYLHGSDAHDDARHAPMCPHPDVPTTVLSVTLAHMSMHSLHVCEDTLHRGYWVSARLQVTCAHNPISMLASHGHTHQCARMQVAVHRPAGQVALPPVPSAVLTDHTTPGLRGLPQTHARSPPSGQGRGLGCNVGTRERQLLAGGWAGRQAGA